MPDRRPRVVYWFNQPTPYVVARFNALAEAGKVDFEAWFSEVRQPDRSWIVDESTWRFRARYVPPRRLLGVRLRTPVAELRDTRPDLLVLEYDRLHLAAGAVAARALAGRVAFRVLPNYDTWSRRTWWRELAKHFLFRSVDAAKVPGPDGARLARRYGMTEDRVFGVRQSIDLPHYSSARSVSERTRAERRAGLGLAGVVFVFVGRLWSGKGLDQLLEAYRSLAVDEERDVSLLVIGDGVEEDRYREVAASLPRVVLAGFVQPAELPSWYALGDCLVFPTLGDPNGLVVEEALAAGLTVITSDAAGDIRDRVEGVGVVVEAGTVAPLANAMRAVAEDPALREHLRGATAAAVAGKTDEAYAADFQAFVENVLSLPPRRGLWAAVCRGAGYALLALAAPRRRPPALLEVQPE